MLNTTAQWIQASLPGGEVTINPEDSQFDMESQGNDARKNANIVYKSLIPPPLLGLKLAMRIWSYLTCILRFKNNKLLKYYQKSTNSAPCLCMSRHCHASPWMAADECITPLILVDLLYSNTLVKSNCFFLKFFCKFFWYFSWISFTQTFSISKRWC